MVRYIKHISFFFALAFIAGCNPGIIDPEPSVIKNVKDYFWNSNATSSLYYEYFRASDSYRKDHEYAFYGLSGNDSKITVRGKQAPDTSSFYFTFDSSGVTAGGLSSHTLFPLPEGYEVEPALSEKEFDTIKYGTKKVIALNNNFAIALRSDDSLFYSTNNGLSWERSGYDMDNGVITAWTRVQMPGSIDIIYAGTSTGTCLKSFDGGKEWKQARTGSFSSKITAIAALRSGYVYITDGTSSVLEFNVNTNDNTPYSFSYPFTSLAACEVGSDTGSSVIIGGTKGGGLIYFTTPKGKTFTSAKNGEKASIAVDIAATGRKSSLALVGKSNSNLKLLYSSDGGVSWEDANSNLQSVQYLDAVASVNTADFVIAGEMGNIYLGSADFGALPILSTPRESLTGRQIKDISISESVIIAAVDSVGVMVSTNRGESWVAGSKGLFQVSVREHRTDGMLTLLPSFADGLKKDDQWLAGNLSNTDVGATAVVEMSAKVFEHYSRLELPFSAGSYNDVYEVVYRCAPSDREVHTVHVYYAKDFGPILFQRFIGEKLIDQSYLKSK